MGQDAKEILEIIPVEDARDMFLEFKKKYQNISFGSTGGFIFKSTIQQISDNFNTGIRAHLCADDNSANPRLFIAIERGMYRDYPQNEKPGRDVPEADHLSISDHKYPTMMSYSEKMNELLRMQFDSNGQVRRGGASTDLKTWVTELFGSERSSSFGPDSERRAVSTDVNQWKRNFRNLLNRGANVITYSNLDSPDLRAICYHLGGFHIAGIWYDFGYDEAFANRTGGNPVRLIIGPVDIYGNRLFNAPAPVAERTYP